MLCHLVSLSLYADEIAAIDPDNTYSMPLKQASTDFGITMPSIAQLKAVSNLLDPDIRDMLVSLSIIDYIGAVALQILRRME